MTTADRDAFAAAYTAAIRTARAAFGPDSRFRIRPRADGGYDLSDRGVWLSRHDYACDAFAAASLLVPTEWRRDTANGGRFVPLQPATKERGK